MKEFIVIQYISSVWHIDLAQANLVSFTSSFSAAVCTAVQVKRLRNPVLIMTGLFANRIGSLGGTQAVLGLTLWQGRIHEHSSTDHMMMCYSRLWPTYQIILIKLIKDKKSKQQSIECVRRPWRR